MLKQLKNYYLDEREAEIVGQVRNWRVVNRHLVGHYGGPSVYHISIILTPFYV